MNNEVKIADIEIGMIVSVRYKEKKEKKELIVIKSIDTLEKEIRGSTLEMLSSNLLKQSGHPDKDGEHVSFLISYDKYEYEICTLTTEETQKANELLEQNTKHIDRNILRISEEITELGNHKNFIQKLKQQINPQTKSLWM